MKLKCDVMINFVILAFFAVSINAANTSTQDLEAQDKSPSKTNAPINARAIELFNADYTRNVEDLLKTRRFFRKAANWSEASGNTFLYVSAGAPAIAAAIHPFSSFAANIITGVGLVSLGTHVALIGLAKCSAREEGEREKQLKALAEQVGFQVVPLIPTITDDSEEKG